MGSSPALEFLVLHWAPVGCGAEEEGRVRAGERRPLLQAPGGAAG